MRKFLKTGGMILVLFVLLGHPPNSVFAGMGVWMPEDAPTVLRLREEPHQRFQSISFFVLCFLLSTAVVQFLWNVLAKEFPKLPRLSYRRALAFVMLWGLLFIIVLTMISGARELMTPGAWRKDGFTYTLEAESESSDDTPSTGDSE